MSEHKTITLTVPYHDDPIRRADGALWDGRDRTGAAKDGRSIAVLHVDIGKALLASWPGEPASDYAKRLAEIEAEVARRAKPLPFYYGKVTAVLHEDRRDDLGWLLGQLRATSEALAALGIPDDGRPLAERVGDLAQGRRQDLADLAALGADDATIGEDRPCFTGSKEATIAKLAAVNPALAADVARANGVDSKG